MNFGFRLVLHRSIPQEDRALCLDFLQNKEQWFLSENSYKTGGWCSGSFFRRGIFGVRLEGSDSSKPPRYTFRRLSKNRRIFGVVPVGVLERVDGLPLQLNLCMCAHHLGGQRVRLKDGFREEDFETFCEHGEIKG